MNILFIGDIVGRPGRDSVARWLPELREEFAVDIVVANAENSAGGLGATPETIRELFAMDVQAITMGNHTWRKRQLVNGIDALENVVRPANYPPDNPGRGSAVIDLADGRKLGLVNVIGRVYMEPFACPFEVAEREAEAVRAETPVVLVDMHAEATAEKVALGWHLDGKCTAVVGTHTHVQTADERILPQGTAYISDVGMTGPTNSVIGMECAGVLRKFVTGMPERWEVAKGRPALMAVVIQADDSTGSATSIERVFKLEE